MATDPIFNFRIARAAAPAVFIMTSAAHASFSPKPPSMMKREGSASREGKKVISPARDLKPVSAIQFRIIFWSFCIAESLALGSSGWLLRQKISHASAFVFKSGAVSIRIFMALQGQ
jgi:hypothetical protein